MHHIREFISILICKNFNMYKKKKKLNNIYVKKKKQFSTVEMTLINKVFKK